MGPLSYKEHGYTSLAKSFDFEKKQFSTKRPSSEAPEQFFQSFILEEALQILSSFEIRRPIFPLQYSDASNSPNTTFREIWNKKLFTDEYC